MTDVKISQLPAATTPLAGTELVPIVQGGVTKQVAIGGTISASQIINTPSGTLAATTVQAAINEIVSDNAASSGSSLVGFLQSGTGAVATTVQAKLRESVSVNDFGAVGDGVADDTAAIQAALNVAGDGFEVKFLSDEYKITSGLTCNANNLTLTGAGGYSKSMITCAVASTQMLTIGGYGFKMQNLALRGDGGSNGSGATVKGIRFVRSDATKDIDSQVLDSSITGMAECIYVKGTNLLLSRNAFSSSLLGVNFIRNSTDESRGLRVVGNRFHSMGTIGLSAKCVVLNADAFDCEVKDNFADNIYSFYEGPINGINVDGNSCYRVSGPCINVLTATYTTQQRCGSVSENTIFCNAPSYVGSAITLRMQNAQAVGNSVIGPREYGIQMLSTTGSIISHNTIVAPNYNSAVDGSIYDGIYADGGSTANFITNNHIRSTGVSARSALNITSSDNIVGPHWIDSTYATPYYSQLPTLATNNSGIGIKKAPSTSKVLDAIGRVINVQQPDAVSANPVEYQAAFTVSGVEKQSASIKFPVQSSSAGAEKVNAEIWVMSNGTLTKQFTFYWNGGFTLTALSAAPSGPVTYQIAMSDGTVGTASWGASGAGLYRYSGSAWVFVG